MALEIRLAGHNLDRDLLLEIRRALARVRDLPAGLSAEADEARVEAAALLEKDNWTPETLSAAYARISRDPRAVHELRAAAREEVEAARRSNETIIFGFGHASVAEHAVFNLDILGISRLAVEEVQRTRLGSYTEKSQRYILLEEEFVIPEEIVALGLEKEMREAIARQNAFYRSAYETLLPWVLERHPEIAGSKKHRRTLEGLAKEDARYGLSLATTVQMGATWNARSLERLIARTAAHPLSELRDFSRKLHASIGEIAPSIVKHTAPAFSRSRSAAAARRWGQQTAALARPSAASAAGPVAEAVLVAAPPDADLLVVAALLHSYGHGDAAACRERAAALGANGREELLRDLLKEISPHDPVPREFEVAALTFELVPSAACFAQLKRHRMTTLTAQDYDVSLGVTIPPSFVATGLDGPFEELRAEAERLHARVLESGTAEAAPYLLLNAHRRRVLWTVNARELYHVARLRLDSHAQWDIRRLIGHVLDLARESAPSLLLLACGKDLFDQTRQDVFGEGGTA